MRRSVFLVLLLLSLAVTGAGKGSQDKRFRVGLVVPVGGTSVPGFRQQIAGLRRAVRELGIEAKVVSPGPREGPLPSLLALARRNYDLIVGIAFPGTMQATKDKRVWGIGVDSDQSSLGPHILTSAVAHDDVLTFELIRSVTKRGFRGGRTTAFGLREDAVGLGKISPTVPRQFVAQVERIKRQITSRKIRVPSTLP